MIKKLKNQPYAPKVGARGSKKKICLQASEVMHVRFSVYGLLSAPATLDNYFSFNSALKAFTKCYKDIPIFSHINPYQIPF
jgi:hypothetical protein